MVLLKILHWLFTKVYMNIICHRFLDIIYCYKLKMIYFTKKNEIILLILVLDFTHISLNCYPY